MREVTATLTSKGQVTIPAEVRRRLGLGRHDKVVFVLEDDGQIYLKAPRFPSVSSLRGAAGTLPQPMSWDRVQEIAAEDRTG